MVRVAFDKLKESKKGDDEPKKILVDGARDEPMPKSNPEHRTEASRERNKEREKKERVMDREREREREMVHVTTILFMIYL